ncbi:hypothetical protein, partial [Streptococcus pneumoniae]|uniref:hypothetical protein n=1 Tax=Streptococcus pneumoniae TaxID=1313 RepID=UPI0018B0E14F
FAVDGVSGTFVGIHNRFAYQETLAVGGYQESVDAVIVASKAQFADRWLPTRNVRVFVSGKAYTIKAVSEDEVQYTFGLMGINS